MIKHRNRLKSISSPARYADHIRSAFPDALGQVVSLLRHPRSLARPIATWRPPSIVLPPLPGHAALSLTASRMRVGEAARHIVSATGETRTPAYLVTIRVTNPSGHRVSRALAEGWVRALLENEQITAVHELTDEPTPTFCWLIDSRFAPVASPASLFQSPAHAA